MTRLFTFAVALLIAVSASAAKSSSKSSSGKKAKQPAKTAATAAPAKSSTVSAHRKDPYVGAISADAKSGRILFQDNADAIAYPASVTKLMTALLVLEDIKAKKYDFSTRITATADVYRCEPSCVGLKAGQSMTVDDLLMALMVKSANDAAIALGVNSAGSLNGFVAKMNERAEKLGMTKTKYFNPNGLPAPKYGKEFNRSTAADQLKLAKEIIKYPDVFRYSSSKTATVTDGNGEKLSMLNHNRILRMDKFHVINPDGTEAVDGLKTGYINAGGSSIVLTGKRSGKRVIVVVLGSASSDIREAQASKLLKDALGAVAW